MFSHTQSLLMKYKKIFECLSFFWKVICFLQKCQKLKKQCCPVLATWLRVNQVASLYRSFSRLTGGSTSQLRKRLRKIFQNFRCFKFSRLGLATCSRVEAPVVRLYRSFHGSLRDFLTGVPSNREKHLDNFSKILSQRCLAT